MLSEKSGPFLQAEIELLHKLSTIFHIADQGHLESFLLRRVLWGDIRTEWLLNSGSLCIIIKKIKMHHF